jgi:folate-dependent phosphoribosylglycinamide formyltransferase PurN
MPQSLPTVVLICHERDAIDREGLARWIASTMTLAGVVVIHDRGQRLRTALSRERARSGLLGLVDVLLFRLYALARLAPHTRAWRACALADLRRRYPDMPVGVPEIVVETPNDDRAREWLAQLAPDVIIARCKYILRPDIFERARVGTFVLHPGICPEYRNAHGCFWALANRDLARVGMTLLKVDRGIDTGPVYLHATTAFDEVRESHVQIQDRVVLDNLEPIAHMLRAICRGEAQPVNTVGRASAVWGHPRLSSYLKWKWQARRNADGRRLPALS